MTHVVILSTTDATVPAASPALLLTSETELIVAPKTRQAIASTSNITHDLAATEEDVVSKTSSPEWERLKRQLIRLLPSALAPLNHEAPPLDEDAALVSPALYRQIKSALPSLRCTLSHRARPQPKVAAAADKEKEKAGEKELLRLLSNVEVRIASNDRIPQGHIWIGEKLRSDLNLSPESSFDLLK